MIEAQSKASRVRLTSAERECFERFTEKQLDEDGWYSIWLAVGVQRFMLGGRWSSDDEADWMRMMLAKALTRVQEACSEKA